MFYDIKTLEFDKILAQLSEYAASSYAKKKILDITPIANARKIIVMLDEVDEARLSIVKYQTAPFAGLSNQDEIIQRIRLKATLSISDFLALKDLLYCTKNIFTYYFVFSQKCFLFVNDFFLQFCQSKLSQGVFVFS